MPRINRCVISISEFAILSVSFCIHLFVCLIRCEYSSIDLCIYFITFVSSFLSVFSAYQVNKSILVPRVSCVLYLFRIACPSIHSQIFSHTFAEQGSFEQRGEPIQSNKTGICTKIIRHRSKRVCEKVVYCLLSL